jgi:exopolyphosphatase/guanosine-5'-triphosphate,3'-diphosphate pyrophosphatase
MLAAIDVGSNTVRLAVGQPRQGGFSNLRYIRRVTRLAGGSDPRTGLAADRMDHTIAALEEMSDLVASAGIDAVRVVGTEALRRAPNAEEFVARVKLATGLALHIIGGEEEARLSYLGVFAALDPRPDHCLVFDIGGGSTEFIWSEQGNIVFNRSYPLGVVDLCERYAESSRQLAYIDTILEDVVRDLTLAGIIGMARQNTATLVGTAGTVTTLAAIKLRMVEYDGMRVNNLVLSRNEIESLACRLAPLSIAQREQLPGLEKGRGDLIMPGLRIILSILDRFEKSTMKVSDFGLLEGLLLQMTGYSDDFEKD